MVRSNFAEAPLESTLEKQIREYAERRGWFVLKFTSPGKRHVQDRVMIRRGVVIFAEIKRADEGERRAQAVRRRQMEAHGAICYVFNDFEEARLALR